MTQQKLPNQRVPIAKEGGIVNEAWSRFFQGLVSPPSQVEPVTVGASPFDFTSSEPGSLVVRAGTVSAISLVRGGSALALGVTSGLIPVGIDDTIRITYTVAPTVTFIPG